MSHKVLDHAKWVSISQQQSLHSSSSSSISNEKDFVFEKQKHQIQTKLMEFHLFSAILLFFSFCIYFELWCVSGNLWGFDAGICRGYTTTTARGGRRVDMHHRESQRMMSCWNERGRERKSDELDETWNVWMAKWKFRAKAAKMICTHQFVSFNFREREFIFPSFGVRKVNASSLMLWSFAAAQNKYYTKTSFRYTWTMTTDYTPARNQELSRCIRSRENNRKKISSGNDTQLNLIFYRRRRSSFSARFFLLHLICHRSNNRTGDCEWKTTDETDRTSGWTERWIDCLCVCVSRMS